MPCVATIVIANHNVRFLQAENVKRKQELAKAKAAEKAAKGGKKQEGPKKKMWWDEELEDAKAARREREADDDAEYYRDEVGMAIEY